MRWFFFPFRSQMANHHLLAVNRPSTDRALLSSTMGKSRAPEDSVIDGQNVKLDYFWYGETDGKFWEANSTNGVVTTRWAEQYPLDCGGLDGRRTFPLLPTGGARSEKRASQKQVRSIARTSTGRSWRERKARPRHICTCLIPAIPPIAHPCPARPERATRAPAALSPPLLIIARPAPQ